MVNSVKSLFLFYPEIKQYMLQYMICEISDSVVRTPPPPPPPKKNKKQKTKKKKQKKKTKTKTKQKNKTKKQKKTTKNNKQTFIHVCGTTDLGTKETQNVEPLNYKSKCFGFLCFLF